MSEFSESIQVRTDDAAAAIAALRDRGFNGAVFRGDRGWLTVVPYVGANFLTVQADAFVQQFVAALNLPVMLYVCHEDHFWGFVLGLPNGTLTTYQCGYDESVDPPAPVRITLADETMLAEVVDLDRVRACFVAPEAGECHSEPAHRFASAMGFPAYVFLSPTYLLRGDVDALRSIGGEEVGLRPEVVKDWPG